MEHITSYLINSWTVYLRSVKAGWFKCIYIYIYIYIYLYIYYNKFFALTIKLCLGQGSKLGYDT